MSKRDQVGLRLNRARVREKTVSLYLVSTHPSLSLSDRIL
jgi:hypothetical protein